MQSGTGKTITDWIWGLIGVRPWLKFQGSLDLCRAVFLLIGCSEVFDFPESAIVHTQYPMVSKIANKLLLTSVVTLVKALGPFG